MPVRYMVSQPPSSPIAMLMSVSSGLRRVVDVILGRTRKLAELMPIISIASICSVIRMVPISEEMLEPILPARMRHTMVEQNSRTSDSRVMYPMYIFGRKGEVMLLAVWMTRTAPINTDIRAMSGMELMMNTSLRNIRYRPVSYRKCLIMSSKVRIISLKWPENF